MFVSRVICVLLCALAPGLVLSGGSAWATIIETQTFDTEAGAAAAGWVEVNTSGGSGLDDYGFSDTANAGGTAGEAGGTVQRGDLAGYYADTTLGGTLDRSDAIEASGLLDVTNIGSAFNGGVHFRHFATDKNGAVGFALLEAFGSTTSVQAQSFIAFSDGSCESSSKLHLTDFPNSDRTWSYAFDPTGGTESVGLLSFTIDGAGGGTLTVELDSSHAGKDFSLNAFGMVDGTVGSPLANNTITSFIDNLEYTVVPEPSSLVLLAGLAVGLAGFGWRRRRKSSGYC